MQRRALLRGMLAGLPVAATGAAAAAYAHSREAVDGGLERVSARVDALARDVRESKQAQKRMFRTLAVLTGLSLGIDISAFL